MKKVAVFPGSFDPFTLGHLDIVCRAATLFDKVWIVLATNTSKKYLLHESERKNLIELSTKNLSNVKVVSFKGLTIDFLKKIKAHYLVRGIRGGIDLSYEQGIAWANQKLYNDCETIFLSSKQEYLHISSTIVREILKEGVNDSNKLSKFIPKPAITPLLSYLEK